jgi:hypothetical protein
MDGLGDFSWEVSGLSQVKCDTVVSTVARVPDGSGGAGLGGDGGEWHVDDVTVCFARHRGEQHACFGRVGDWGLAWGQPSGWEVGGWVQCSNGGGLSVPGSEGGELVGWHVESWDVGIFLYCTIWENVTILSTSLGVLKGTLSSSI